MFKVHGIKVVELLISFKILHEQRSCDENDQSYEHYICAIP